MATRGRHGCWDLRRLALVGRNPRRRRRRVAGRRRCRHQGGEGAHRACGKCRPTRSRPRQCTGWAVAVRGRTPLATAGATRPPLALSLRAPRAQSAGAFSALRPSWSSRSSPLSPTAATTAAPTMAAVTALVLAESTRHPGRHRHHRRRARHRRRALRGSRHRNPIHRQSGLRCCSQGSRNRRGGWVPAACLWMGWRDRRGRHEPPSALAAGWRPGRPSLGRRHPRAEAFPLFVARCRCRSRWASPLRRRRQRSKE